MTEASTISTSAGGAEPRWYGGARDPPRREPPRARPAPRGPPGAPRAPPRPRGPPLRRRVGSGAAGREPSIERLHAPHRATAAAIGGRVGDDAQQPGTERTPRVVLVELHERRQHGVLRCVIRIFGVAQHRPGYATRHAGVALHQHAEGRAVPRGRPEHQVRLVLLSYTRSLLGGLGVSHRPRPGCGAARRHTNRTPAPGRTLRRRARRP